MDERLTFCGPVRSPPSRRLGWIVTIAIVFCIASVAALTVMLPNSDQFSSRGGYVPIATPR